MARRRFYSEQLTSGRITLDAEQSRHARKSLRLDLGDVVELFDGSGQVAAGKVVESHRELIIEVEQVETIPRPALAVTIAAAVPKGDRAATLIEKLSELGADRFIPLLTEYSVVDPRPGKVDRFRRIAIESAKQCGRAYLMTVEAPTPFDRVLAQVREREDCLRLIADVPCDGGQNGYRQIENFLHKVNSTDDHQLGAMHPTDHALMLIGPEGGWSDRERALAKAAGWISWRISDQILRVETAAVAGLAILRYPGFGMTRLMPANRQ